MARARLRKLTLLFTSSLAFLAPSAVAPGLPALYADFAHVANAELLSQLVLTMPMLCVALSGPLVGWAVDRCGRKTTLIACAVGYGLSGMSGLVLEDLAWIVVGRAFLGIFLAGILTAVTTLIGDYFVGFERHRFAGIQGAFISFGTLVFVVLAGLLSEIHWRAAFALFGVALVLVVPMMLSLYEPPRPSPGAVAPTDLVARRGELSTIFAISALAFIFMVAAFLVPSQTQFLLVGIGVTDPTRAGLAIGMFNFSAGLASLAYFWLRRRFSAALIFALVFFNSGVGFVLVGAAHDYAAVMIALAIGGFSVGAFLPNANMVIISRTSATIRGRALGATTAAFFLGQFASPFYSLPVAERLTLGGMFALSGYWLIGLAALFLLLAAIGAMRNRRRPLDAAPPWPDSGAPGGPR